MAGETQAVAPIALHALLMSDAKRRAHAVAPTRRLARKSERIKPPRTSINVDPHQHQHRSSAAFTSIRNSIKGVPQTNGDLLQFSRAS